MLILVWNSHILLLCPRGQCEKRVVGFRPVSLYVKQIGQLSQTNRAAAWVSFGKNISGRQVCKLHQPLLVPEN